jgi:hypothetical protein
MPIPLDLNAVAAIRQLKSRYCRLLDLKQWAEWGQLFTEDAVMVVKDDVPPELGDPTTRGRAAIVEQVSRIMQGAISIHQVHEPDITLLSYTKAEGIWGMHDYVTWPEGVRPPVPFKAKEAFGYYYETYRRVGEHWCIESIDLRRLHAIKTPL